LHGELTFPSFRHGGFTEVDADLNDAERRPEV
jgi:hypothetical protein